MQAGSKNVQPDIRRMDLAEIEWERVHMISTDFAVPKNLIAAALTLLPLGVCQSEAAEPWNFVRLRAGSESIWEVQKGTAKIEMSGNRITIIVYFDGDNEGDQKDRPPFARIEIKGTVGPDQTVSAVSTLLDTDAGPRNVRGKISRRTDQEWWGTKRKLVTREEIVFGHPPNEEFLGFVRKTARDQ
ncbi:hypothetical protein ACQR13_11030 [Bradyrhizobium sp. HKCCYLRH3059]|uniref:hypothetical protein n=1 Tax=Bradyrhizobium sp. HKCCYLRH3059 TaxID=3420745 RepID=UPI003EBBF603